MTQDSTGKNACDVSETRVRAVDTACPWKTRVLQRSLLSQVRVRKRKPRGLAKHCTARKREPLSEG